MAKFVIATVAQEQYPHHDLFECALIGRSNVGKSTLINALAKTAIAYVSKTPGRTRTINFYDYKAFWLVDLPGYGYAKLNKQTQTQLVAMGEDYLMHRPQLMSVIHICDINVITQLDFEMQSFLTAKFDNYILCLNKIDKLSFSQQKKALQTIQNQMQLKPEQILLISAKKKTNTASLLNIIKTWTKK